MRPRPTRSTRLLAGLAAGPLVLLGACSGGSELSSGGEQGFVTADGSVQVVDAAERKDPAYAVTGETVDGTPLDLADYRGETVVMPVWGSWCAPCRAEAPLFAEAARDLADKGVVFLGINNRDTDEASARRFVEQFDIPYDSLYDPDGNVLLSFRGTLPPTAVPSLVVIDPEGRVAARIIGKTSATTLYGTLEDVTGEQLTTPAGGDGGDGGDGGGDA